MVYDKRPSTKEIFKQGLNGFGHTLIAIILFVYKVLAKIVWTVFLWCHIVKQEEDAISEDSSLLDGHKKTDADKHTKDTDFML